MSLDKRIRPAVGRLAVRVEDIPERSEHGIWLNTARSVQEDRPTQGVVIATSDPDEPWTDEDGEEYKPVYSVGETVLFGKYSGTQVMLGKERVIILKESDIIATLIDPTTEVKIK